MSGKHILSEGSAELTYWQATVVFGREAVNAALSQSPWRERFPGIIHGSTSTDIAVMSTSNRTVLPEQLIYKIAERDDIQYEFYTSEDRERLYSMNRSQPFDTTGWHKITPRNALREYGAYAMFYSVDNMYGTKDQKNPAL